MKNIKDISNALTGLNPGSSPEVIQNPGFRRLNGR